MRSFSRWVRVLLTACAFAGFYAGAAAFSWMILPLLLPRDKSRADRALRAQRVVRRAFIFFHDYMRVTGLIDFDPRAVHLDLPEGPCVVIANHPTLVDVTAIIAAGGPMCCVVKPELLKSFVFGRLLRCCWHIDGRPSAGIGVTAVVDEARRRLEAGMRVLIFPEGTRSPEGGLRRFHRGAFEIAVRTRLPLIPLLLRCEPPMLSKDAPWHRVPEQRPRLTMTRLPTLDAAASQSPATMAADARALYEYHAVYNAGVGSA